MIQDALLKQKRTSLMKPIFWFKSKYQKMVEEGLSENSISQDEYFAKQLQYLAGSNHSIKILGYDEPFMELDETKNQIEKAVSSLDNHVPVYISMIIPQSVRNKKLEELVNSSAFLTILKTPEEISRGFFIYDNFILSLWNSKKTTYYLPEKEKGIYLRSLILGSQTLVRKANERYSLVESNIRKSL